MSANKNSVESWVKRNASPSTLQATPPADASLLFSTLAVQIGRLAD